VSSDLDRLSGSAEPTRRAVESEVRHYLADVLRRYVPAAMFFAGLALVVALFPTVAPSTAENAAGSSRTGTGKSGVTGANGATSSDGTTAAAGGAGANGSAAGGGSSTADNGSAVGIAKSGVTCGADVRQVAWSKYAPLCVPAWSGDNGGAMAPGVTDSTITLTYRKISSSEVQVINAYVPGAYVLDDQLISDMQAYIDLFNQNFELYGRKVVLKPYQAQGDFIAEAEGVGQQGAQADAATAKQLGAFGDVTYLATTTEPYSTALVQQKIIEFNNYTFLQSDLERMAPYAYNYAPTVTHFADFYANMVCKRLNGSPAAYSPDPALRNKNRSFGLVTYDTDAANRTADAFAAQVKSSCGVDFAKRVAIAVNPVAGQQQASSAAAQLKAAGVTTVVVFNVSIYDAADQQKYYPEWLVQNFSDTVTRLAKPSESPGFIGPSNFYFPSSAVSPAASEAYQAFKMARPDAEPAEYQFASAYYSLLQIFSALQQAGPSLTPDTFQQGMFGQPTSLPDGDDGTWSFGDGAYTPVADSAVMHWNPQAVSTGDGQPGAWVACEQGRRYRFFDAGSWGDSQPLAC
jgi:hypothetical protein